MYIKTICTLILSSFFVTAFAQTTIKGKVTDAATAPLAGASISFAGKTFTSDKNGNFNIDCSLGNSVTVSYVGYETKTAAVDCNTNLTIVLTSVGRQMPEVEISATSNPHKALIYVPQSISKLTPVELKRSTGLFFDDIINLNVPGVTFERRAVNSGQSFNIRGYGNGARGRNGVSSNFDGQGYKVYLNGIPVTDAEGITLLDDIDFGSIGNVEVVKGPAGSLYGLAIAGAVNLKTIKPAKGKTTIGQEAIAGSYGLQRYTTTLQTAGERSSLLMNYGKQKSNGYFQHNASRKDFVNLISEFQPRENHSIMAYVGYANSYDERGGEQTIAQYQAKMDSGNIEYIKRDAHSHVISFRAGVANTYGLTRGVSNTTSLFGTGLVTDAASAGGWTDKLSLNYGLRSSFDTRFALGTRLNLSGLTGVELQRQNAQTMGYNFKADPLAANQDISKWQYGDPYLVKNASTSNTATISSTASYFTEWTLSMPHDISLTAGVGVSNMSIHLEDRFNPATATKPATFDASYKNMVSPHVALNKVFNKMFSLYASYSRGYKAPVSSYFFTPIPAVSGGGAARAEIDSSLKAEVADQFEIGAKGSVLKDKLYYEVAVYNAMFKNKMTPVAVKNPNDSTGTTLYSIMRNQGNQNNKGLEVLLKYTAYQSQNGFVRTIRPFGNFTYSNFKYENFTQDSIGKRAAPNATKDSLFSFDYSGRQVAGVPKYTYNVGVDFSFRYGIYGNVTYAYRDAMTITSDGFIRIKTPGSVNIDYVPYETPSYGLLNAKIGIQRPLTNHFDIDAFFGVNNITNTQYPIKVFINQIPDAFVPGPSKANYFGGLNLKYNF